MRVALGPVRQDRSFAAWGALGTLLSPSPSYPILYALQGSRLVHQPEGVPGCPRAVTQGAQRAYWLLDGAEPGRLSAVTLSPGANAGIADAHPG